MRQNYLGQMTEMEQADLIMEKGALVGKRTDGFYNILLFQVDSFYAEIYYHSHFNVIIKIKTFRNTDALEPYLAQIEISKLLD